jgi:hemin uptake protein HemP
LTPAANASTVALAVTDTTTRALDAGSPLFLDEHARTDEPPACGRGVCVETPFDVPTGEDEIALSLRRAEWHHGAADVELDRVSIALALSTGRPRPRDASAARFLAEHPWIDEALAPHLDWLRARAQRRAVQRDRTSCLPTIERQPAEMVPHHDLFPGDWDLIFRHDGHIYWAVALHCLNAACPCSEVTIGLYQIDSPRTEHVGDLRVDLKSTRLTPKTANPRAARLFEPLWARHGAELLMRHGEVRRAVATYAAARGASPGAVEPRILPARNAPCPCGSGRKYKRCCASRDGSRAPGDSAASPTSR